MANTIGWGKATQNNDNGFGKYQNTIGAASIYAESYGGETAIVGTSAAFSYSASSYNQGEADPTPTITGTAGGFFTSDAGVSFIDTSTGQIDLSASTIATHAITYIVDGVQSTQNVGITAIPYQSTRSFSFDGINDYFEISNISSFATNTQGSISFWLNFSGDTSTRYALGISDANANTFLTIGIDTSENLDIIHRNSGSNLWRLTTTGNPITLNTWQHICLTQNGTACEVYVNGVKPTQSGAGTQWLSSLTGLDLLTIGALYKSSALVNPIQGNIDEVSVWDSALSSDAITEIYNSGAPNDLESLTNASSSNLVAWYKMGE